MRAAYLNVASACALLAIAIESLSADAQSAGCTGCFRGLPPKLAKVEGSGRLKKRLLRDLYFTDGRGLVWKANKGDVTDGASIPAIFLSLTGPRFEHDFLPAAIVHDHYTNDWHKVRPWPSTAHVFYEAMVAHQTSILKAKLMYYAVFAFGPHWGELEPGVNCGPRCINLTSSNAVRDKSLRRRGFLVHPKSPTGAQFFSEPEHAEPSDLPEIAAVKAKISTAEAEGRPLSLVDLRTEAARRHPANAFVRLAAADMRD